MRRTRHIHVDFLYRLLPALAGRVLSTLVDVIRIVVLRLRRGAHDPDDAAGWAACKMTIVDLPMNIIYGVCAFGFAAAAVRSVQVAIENWRRDFSILERPEHAFEEHIE